MSRSLNRSLKRYFKKRNWTRKSWSDFKENLHHYLTPKEQSSLPVKNELLTFKPKIQPNPSETLPVSRSLIQTLSREIRKGIHPHFFMFKQDPLIRGKKDQKTGYLQLYESGCEKQLILDLPKWANRFPYFHVETKELSPSGETWLLSIDFVGSRVYHLFLKSLYADDYKEIKIPKKKMLQTSELLANERVSTEQAIWLDDERILYVTLNRYYNDSGVYLYDLKTEKHKRIFAGNTETFLVLNTVNSGLFVLISSLDYHSEEVYLMDVDTLKVSLFIPRKFSVTYPLIQHETGQWFVCKKDKGRDTIATTVDWKHWKNLYENKNPEEQILEVKYEKETWVFTLETLKGLCLYVFKCGQLTLIEKSFDYFGLRQVVDGQFIVHRHKYTCAYTPMAIVLDTLQVIAPPMKPLYQEEEIFIHPHLRVTLIYKGKKKVRPCLLRGYGAYNTYEHPSESPYYYPLLERGFVVAIAHLRGGGEYGFKGYAEGRMLHKKNTFDDFIETAHYLIDQKWTTRDKLAIWGRSCGGLLVSAVLNQEPDLCQVALAGVPYVTPLESMTQNNPLGKVSQTELGNVSIPKVKQYIHSYAPLEHIQKEGKYPHLLIYSNRQDTLVPYHEPVAYYRAMKEVEVYQKGERDLSFHLDPRFGHVQGTLLRDKCDHYGMLFGYVLKHLKL